MKVEWKSRETLKNLETKEMSKAEIFKYDLNFFSVISVSLNYKGKYFSVIILDYHCGFLCIYFKCGFRAFSVPQDFQCDFQCNNSMVIKWPVTLVSNKFIFIYGHECCLRHYIWIESSVIMWLSIKKINQQTNTET